MTSTKWAELPVRELSYDGSPDLVYFSSVSENTRRLADKPDRPAARVPLHPRLEGRLRINRSHALIVPSYGGGDKTQAIPKQVAIFLNDLHNRALLCGITTSGNTNLGEHCCIAGSITAAKCHAPELYRFELLGLDRDVERVNVGLQHLWAEIKADNTSNASSMNLRR